MKSDCPSLSDKPGLSVKPVDAGAPRQPGSECDEKHRASFVDTIRRNGFIDADGYAGGRGVPVTLNGVEHFLYTDLHRFDGYNQTIKSVFILTIRVQNHFSRLLGTNLLSRMRGRKFLRPRPF